MEITKEIDPKEARRLASEFMEYRFTNYNSHPLYKLDEHGNKIETYDHQSGLQPWEFKNSVAIYEVGIAKQGLEDKNGNPVVIVEFEAAIIWNVEEDKEENKAEYFYVVVGYNNEGKINCWIEHDFKIEIQGDQPIKRVWKKTPINYEPEDSF